MYFRETEAADQMPLTSKKDAVTNSCHAFPPEGYQPTAVGALLTVRPLFFGYEHCVLLVLVALMLLFSVFIYQWPTQ